MQHDNHKGRMLLRLWAHKTHPITYSHEWHMGYNFWVVCTHDDITKWKHFPRNWPFVRGIHRSPVNSPHKGQWRGALKFPLICVLTNDWVNNREAGDLRRQRNHCDVSVMKKDCNISRVHWRWCLFSPLEYLLNWFEYFVLGFHIDTVLNLSYV